MESLRRYWWKLHRFGLTPSKLWHRLSDRESPRVFCNSIPKSGTNLIQRALLLLPSLYRKILPTTNGQNVDRWGQQNVITSLRPGQVLVAHLPHSQSLEALLNKEDIPKLLMVRDPRDIVLSHCKHVVRNEEHRLHERYTSLPDAESRRRLTVQGDPENGIDPIRLRFEYFLGWLETDALVVRFENLIGPRGGGTREAQRCALTRIYDHIGIEVDRSDVRALADRLFYTASPTFRKGLIGQWKEKMSPSTKELIEKNLGALIRQYGYEPTVSETVDVGEDAQEDSAEVSD